MNKKIKMKKLKQKLGIGIALVGITLAGICGGCASETNHQAKDWRNYIIDHCDEINCYYKNGEFAKTRKQHVTFIISLWEDLYTRNPQAVLNMDVSGFPELQRYLDIKRAQYERGETIDINKAIDDALAVEAEKTRQWNREVGGVLFQGLGTEIVGQEHQRNRAKE